jgi:hypothetical protein
VPIADPDAVPGRRAPSVGQVEKEVGEAARLAGAGRVRQVSATEMSVPAAKLPLKTSEIR